jgi:putative MATE family efflux protein
MNEQGEVGGAERQGVWSILREAIRGSQQDFTTIPVGKAVFLLAVPMVLEMAMESLFVIVDIFWVSRLGADAVATVGLTESLLATIYAVAVGLSMAATAVVARRTGEKDPEGASRAAVQVIAVSLLSGCAIAIPGFLFGAELLSLMGGTPSVVATGSGYTTVMLGGSVTIILLFILNAIFRGAGDAATAMRTLWMANGLNMILGPCFIFGLGPIPEMGVTGAAVATTIGRGAGIGYQWWMLGRRGGRVTVLRRHLRAQWSTMQAVLRLAGPATLQILIETTSWVGLVRILADFGSAAVAGYTIAIRVALFALLPSEGMANAAATLVGQNLGAERADRAERSVWVVALYNLLFLGLISIAFLTLSAPIVRFFTSDPAVVRHGVDCLRIIALGFLFFAYGMVIVQAFNGAGDTRTPTILYLACFWAFKIPAAYVLAVTAGLGPAGVFVAITAAYSLLALAGLACFRQGGWKQQRV